MEDRLEGVGHQVMGKSGWQEPSEEARKNPSLLSALQPCSVPPSACISVLAPSP
jgi:hypothetical protein